MQRDGNLYPGIKFTFKADCSNKLLALYEWQVRSWLASPNSMTILNGYNQWLLRLRFFSGKRLEELECVLQGKGVMKNQTWYTHWCTSSPPQPIIYRSLKASLVLICPNLNIFRAVTWDFRGVHTGKKVRPPKALQTMGFLWRYAPPEQFLSLGAQKCHFLLISAGYFQ